MTYLQYETRIFDRAISRLNGRERMLASFYVNKRELLTDKIKSYIHDLEKNKYSLSRLNNLYKQIDEQIADLLNMSTEEIASGFKTVYQETYYHTAYNIESDIFNAKNPYSLRFDVLNDKAIEASLSENIGGHTFLDYMADHQSRLQWQLRTDVAGAVIEGLPPAALAKQFKKINETFNWSKARANMTARTELLRAYSVAGEQASSEAEQAGVEMEYVWDSTLDGNTRPSHQNADGKKAEIIDGIPAFSVNGVLLSSPRITHPANTKKAAGEIVYCRCRRSNRPFGFAPTSRAAKLDDGEWIEISGKDNYAAWKKKYIDK